MCQVQRVIAATVLARREIHDSMNLEDQSHRRKNTKDSLRQPPRHFSEECKFRLCGIDHPLYSRGNLEYCGGEEIVTLITR
jgi:hypothetical protein